MKICSVEECGKKTYAKEWCKMHYERNRKTGTIVLRDRPQSCSVDDCEREPYGRGWCRLHWDRWRRHGDPLGSALRATPAERFAANIAPEGDCVAWKGCRTPKGYGQISVNGRKIRAHRFAWEQENGPIPDGMVVDHTCWNRACVNVGHLRLATPQQNNANRSGRTRISDLPRGVSRSKRRYSAAVKGLHLGTFDTPEEASAVAQARRAELFGEFAGRA